MYEVSKVVKVCKVYKVLPSPPPHPTPNLLSNFSALSVFQKYGRIAPDDYWNDHRSSNQKSRRINKQTLAIQQIHDLCSLSELKWGCYGGDGQVVGGSVSAVQAAGDRWECQASGVARW